MRITKEHICICGGGNLGHVIAGLAAYKGYKVSILTRKPNLWHPSLTIKDINGNTFIGKLSTITEDASQAIPKADIVLFGQMHPLWKVQRMDCKQRQLFLRK